MSTSYTVEIIYNEDFEYGADLNRDGSLEGQKNELDRMRGMCHCVIIELKEILQ